MRSLFKEIERKIINGKPFRIYALAKVKSAAKTVQAQLREKGQTARILKIGDHYGIYIGV